jgi:uncharacterized membrane protein
VTSAARYPANSLTFLNPERASKRLHVVGVHDTANGRRDFLWKNGVVINFESLADDEVSAAQAINEHGIVVGVSSELAKAAERSHVVRSRAAGQRARL